MTDNSKLKLDSSCDVCGLEENMFTQKISVSDHVNGFQYTTNKSDSCVIDMESISPSSRKDATSNSRITRSLSRKGLIRGVEKKINSNTTAYDTDAIATASTPRGAIMPEKAAAVAVGTTDQPGNPQVHHQITITAGNNGTVNDSKYGIRRNSFKRPPPSWVFDPKRVLFFFATLSSMGTILLICFTLSMGKLNADESVLN